MKILLDNLRNFRRRLYYLFLTAHSRSLSINSCWLFDDGRNFLCFFVGTVQHNFVTNDRLRSLIRGLRSHDFNERKQRRYDESKINYTTRQKNGKLQSIRKKKSMSLSLLQKETV